MIKLLTIAVLLLSSSIGLANDLTVQVTGLKSTTGNLLIALFNNAQGFPNDNKMAIEKIISPVNYNFTSTIKNLKAGTYAVAIFHDKNKDEILNTNILGIPKEGFGFSMNPKITVGAPRFNKSSFVVSEEKRKTITFRLKHY